MNISIPPEVGRAGTRLLVLIILIGVFSLIVFRPPFMSGAFVITVFTIAFGAGILGVLLIIVRRNGARHPAERLEEESDPQ